MNKTAPTIKIAAIALLNPYDRVIAPPIASKARNEIEPIAVLATRNDDHFRARNAVKRRAKSSSVSFATH